MMSPLLEKAINQLKHLPEAEQTRVASLILNNLNSRQFENLAQAKENHSELSEVLLLPELEAGEEELFTRNQDTGREITL